MGLLAFLLSTVLGDWLALVPLAGGKLEGNCLSTAPVTWHPDTLEPACEDGTDESKDG